MQNHDKKWRVIVHRDSKDLTLSETLIPRIVPLFLDMDVAQRIGSAHLAYIDGAVWGLLAPDWDTERFEKTPHARAAFKDGKTIDIDGTIVLEGGRIFCVSVDSRTAWPEAE
jgi:hypothetical protein